MSCLPQKAQTARGAPTSLHYVKFCITHTKSHNLHFCLLKPLCILEHVPVLKKRVKSAAYTVNVAMTVLQSLSFHLSNPS